MNRKNNKIVALLAKVGNIKLTWKKLIEKIKLIKKSDRKTASTHHASGYNINIGMGGDSLTNINMDIEEYTKYTKIMRAYTCDYLPISMVGVFSILLSLFSMEGISPFIEILSEVPVEKRILLIEDTFAGQNASSIKEMVEVLNLLLKIFSRQEMLVIIEVLNKLSMKEHLIINYIVLRKPYPLKDMVGVLSLLLSNFSMEEIIIVTQLLNNFSIEKHVTISETSTLKPEPTNDMIEILRVLVNTFSMEEILIITKLLNKLSREEHRMITKISTQKADLITLSSDSYKKSNGLWVSLRGLKDQLRFQSIRGCNLVRYLSLKGLKSVGKYFGEEKFQARFGVSRAKAFMNFMDFVDRVAWLALLGSSLFLLWYFQVPALIGKTFMKFFSSRCIKKLVAENPEQIEILTKKVRSNKLVMIVVVCLGVCFCLRFYPTGHIPFRRNKTGHIRFRRTDPSNILRLIPYEAEIEAYILELLHYISHLTTDHVFPSQAEADAFIETVLGYIKGCIQRYIDREKALMAEALSYIDLD